MHTNAMRVAEITNIYGHSMEDTTSNMEMKRFLRRVRDYVDPNFVQDFNK